MYKGKTITVTNCCDGKFEPSRKACSETSISVGKADRVLEYKPSMLDDEFKSKNKDLLSVKRGAGLWLWKPYFILKALESVPENHYLIYLDAGVIVINEFSYLIESMERSGQDIMVFEVPLLEEEWTKKEVFSVIYPDLTESVNQILSGYIVIKNTPFSRKIIEEWCMHMQNPICSLPQNVTDEPNYWNFVENRDDQSVLSLICRKHGVIPFRDPSQFGKYPYKYAWLPKFKHKWRKYSYRPLKYDNSPYPQIVISNRIENPEKKIKKEKIIRFFDRVGVYKPLYMLILKPFLSIVENK